MSLIYINIIYYFLHFTSLRVLKLSIKQKRWYLKTNSDSFRHWYSKLFKNYTSNKVYQKYVFYSLTLNTLGLSFYKFNPFAMFQLSRILFTNSQQKIDVLFMKLFYKFVSNFFQMFFIKTDILNLSFYCKILYGWFSMWFFFLHYLIVMLLLIKKTFCLH